MNKNTIIGLLVLIVVLGGGYYIVNNDRGTQDPILNTQTKDDTKEPIEEVAETPGTPSVTTSKNNFTSISTASLSGTVRPNGASTTYWFEHGESSTSFTSHGAEQTIGGGYSAIPATGYITGLRANTTYYYRLNAKNKFGTVNGAVYTLQTNNANPPEVSKPTVRTSSALNVERTTATIAGEVNPNSSATSYWFEYGTDNDFGDVTTYQATNSGSTFMPVSASLSGLAPMTKYYFRLNGQNQFGTVNGTTMNFTTDGPALSSKPKVEVSNPTKVTSSSATFVGHINPGDAETAYWFEYSNNSLLGNIVKKTTAKKTITGKNTQQVQASVSELSSDTEYSYALVASNSNGSVTSENISFTTKK